MYLGLTLIIGYGADRRYGSFVYPSTARYLGEIVDASSRPMETEKLGASMG